MRLFRRKPKKTDDRFDKEKARQKKEKFDKMKMCWDRRLFYYATEIMKNEPKKTNDQIRIALYRHLGDKIPPDSARIVDQIVEDARYQLSKGQKTLEDFTPKKKKKKK